MLSLKLALYVISNSAVSLTFQYVNLKNKFKNENTVNSKAPFDSVMMCYGRTFVGFFQIKVNWEDIKLHIFE